MDNQTARAALDATPFATPVGHRMQGADSVAADLALVPTDPPPVPAGEATELDAEFMAVPGYERLAAVLHAAYKQAAGGKGKERHASDGIAFEDQPMNSINRLLGTNHGHIYQATKKAVESQRLPRARAIAELYGAINYLAGAVIHLEDQPGTTE